MIVKKPLPHSSVPTGGIKDPAVRDAVMKLSENVVILHAQVSELQGACQVMERELNGALNKISVILAV